MKKPHIYYDSRSVRGPEKLTDRAVFLDRDGVINLRRLDYVKNLHEFKLLPGVLDAIRELSSSNLRIFVVTNQSCIGRGLTTLSAIKGIHQHLLEKTGQHGGRIDGIALCPHRPDELCACRKPHPGMLLQLAEEQDLSLNKCYMVGDATTDAMVALTVGARAIVVAGGPFSMSELTEKLTDNSVGDRIWFSQSLPQATNLILQDLVQNSL